MCVSSVVGARTKFLYVSDYLASTVMSLLEAPYLIEAPQMGLQVVTK